MNTVLRFALGLALVLTLRHGPASARAAEYFTEYWGGAGVTEDVAFHSLTFSPNGSPAFYALCVEPASNLPVDPAGGTVFPYLTEWDFEEIALSDGKRVWLYGQSYDTLYISASGFITFTQGDPSGWTTLQSHFSLPRVSGVGGWLSPYENVSWQQLDDRVVATWDQVWEHWIAGGTPSTFQIELFFDGRIRITFLEIGVYDPMVAGLSEGNGVPPDFVETDFTAYGCDAAPPRAYDVDVATDLDTPILIALLGDDDGQPDPPGALETIIVSLPVGGDLVDPGSGVIAGVPHTLSDRGNVVEYVPSAGFGGVDRFEFKVNDGGVPYAGGDSLRNAEVTVSVSVPRRIYYFPLDANPGWTTSGQWSFGTPLGGGGPGADPTSGFTGPKVFGYNLAGNYENNLPPTHLTTTAIDCTNLGATELRFRRWLGIETAWFDHASISVSNDGEYWTTVWDFTGATLTESDWSEQVYDISSVADGAQSVFVRWTMGPTNAQNTYPGWNIDDIEIWALAPTSAGDCNADGVVDIDDLEILADCLAGPQPSPPSCDPPASTCVDLDDDNDVDLSDFWRLQSNCDTGG